MMCPRGRRAPLPPKPSSFDGALEAFRRQSIFLAIFLACGHDALASLDGAAGQGGHHPGVRALAKTTLIGRKTHDGQRRAVPVASPLFV
jgi:hypothetical protein